MSEQIKDMRDLCDMFYADEPAMLNRRIYKGTDCGASISVYLPRDDEDDDIPEGYELVYSSGYVMDKTAIHHGDPAWRELTMDTPIHSFTIQTIVEGSDATVDSELFVLPVDKSKVWKFIEYMEDESSRLWDRDNTTLIEAYYLEDGEPVDLGTFKQAATENGIAIKDFEFKETGAGYFRTMSLANEELDELTASDFEDQHGDAFTVLYVEEGGF